MPDDYGVVNTSSHNWNVMHDAARPYAVVQFSRKGTVQRVISRHQSYHGACIKRGLIAKAAA